MLSIKKVINNNIVVAMDSKLREFVVVGKGIGFGKKIDDLISEEEVEKKYSLMYGEAKLLDYMQEVDYKLLDVCDTIKNLVEETCNTKYTNYMFFGLVDHINTAIIRARLDVKVPSDANFENIKVYNREFELAKRVTEIINENFDVQLGEDETNFIALHFITLNYDIEYSQANEKVLQISKDIVDIIRYKTKREYEDDFNMKRFTIHLKYFIIRQLNNNKIDSQYNDDLYRLLISQYEEAAKILNIIVDYLETSHKFIVEPDERMYLLIHLVKIVN